jgi:para-nitrobenzyl esterase
VSAPRLETRDGVVRGTETPEGVQAFLGVPFAAPPRGVARFLPPAPPRSWSGEREAIAFGAPAPQTRGMMARLLGLPREPDEDCLTLNVWRPAGPGRRAALVWIHGGSFTSGTGASPVYDGARLAARGDAVVVTLNYRLGLLGFLRLSGEPATGAANRGLLDQLAALEWVRAHADALGADPSRITLFGESAGAMSVATLMAAPAARGRFARAACQSGGGDHVHDEEAAARVTRFVLGELGVRDDADAPRRLAEQPLAALLEVQERAIASLWREVPGLLFQPVVDGALVPERPVDAVRAGRAAPVPLLLGTNADEYRLWSLTDPRAATLDEERLLRRLRRTIRGADRPGARVAEHVARVYREARRRRGEPAEPADLWFAIEGDRTLRMPALRLAGAHAARGHPTFVYRFVWRSPALEGRLGACHALEIPFVFGSLGEPQVAGFTGAGAEASELSGRMMDAWLAFACRGEPRHAHLPDWPPYDPARRPAQILGATCPVETDPYGDEGRLWDGLEAGGDAPG